MSTRPRPLNYTTTVAAARTAVEVVDLLGSHGAESVGLRYEGRQPVGVAFVLPLPGGSQAYELDVDAAAALRHLRQARQDGDRNLRPGHLTPEHAQRVAWRVVKDWLEAQLAMVAAGLARTDQVMLPYARAGEVSAYQAWADARQRALATAGDE